MRDDDPALSFWRDPPLFYVALVIGLAALAGSTARHLRGEGPELEAAEAGQQLPQAAEPGAPHPGQRPEVRVAAEASRVHSQ